MRFLGMIALHLSEQLVEFAACRDTQPESENERRQHHQLLARRLLPASRRIPQRRRTDRGPVSGHLHATAGQVVVAGDGREEFSLTGRPGFVVGHDPHRHRVVVEGTAESVRELGDVGFARRTRMMVIDRQSSSVTDRVGLRNGPGIPAETGLGRRIHGQRTRAARPGVARPVRQEGRRDHGDPAAAAAAGPRSRPVGRTPEARARRPRLWPGQARAAQRDPGPVALGPVGVRLAGTRLRQCRDPRPVRHPGAEDPLPAAAARRRDHLVLLDDRAAGRFRPGAVRDAAPNATAEATG